jgi:hypothetical protein
MNVRLAVALCVVVLSLSSCAGQDAAESDATWVGTITTEGNVTTVVNESGSVWNGSATLVEEASIGEEGAGPEHLLGSVRDLATDGQRIFVADSQALVVRVYDLAGNHLMDVGAPGQGPGEFQEAKGVGVSPDGRIFVQDDRARKIHVFDGQGEFLEAWDRQWRSAYFDGRFTVGPEGPFIYMTLNPEAPRDEQVSGMVLACPDGFAWAQGDIVARFRERDPTWTWDGPDAPQTKPFFSRLLIGSGGRVWVLREIEGKRIQVCARGSDDPVERVEQPCWRQPRVFDVFESGGRFLTTVAAPPRLRPDIWPVIDAIMLLAAEEGEVGNVVVKRYRLVLPEEQ